MYSHTRINIFIEHFSVTMTYVRALLPFSSSTPLTTVPSYRGVQASSNNGPDLSKLGTFERTLLQTTGPTSTCMPNVLQIPYVCVFCSRNVLLVLIVVLAPEVFVLADTLCVLYRTGGVYTVL